MTIMDGVKFGFGVSLGRAILTGLSSGVLKYTAENEWENSLMRVVKENILKDKKLCKRLNIETVTEEKEEPVMRSIGFERS